jgi:hypothetical protein
VLDLGRLGGKCLAVLVRLRRPLALLAVLGIAMVACAEPEEQAMCPAYAQFVGVYEIVAASDPTGATAGDAAEAVEVAVGELRQLRAVADQRYSAPIDQLEALLDDLGRTLDSLVDEEDYDTWAPLVEDTTDDVEIAYARLRRVMDPACADRSDNDESAADAADQEDFAWTVY